MEENGENGQIQTEQPDIVEKGAKMVEETAKTAVENKAKKEGQKIATKIISVIGPYILPVIGILILSGAVFGVIDKVVDIFIDAKNAISSFFKVDENGISLPTENDLLNAAYDQLNSSGINIEDLHLGKEDKAKKYLYKFMKASYVTQIPYINRKNTDNIYGIVKIKRNKDGNVKDLIYRSYNGLKELIDENNTDALDYFAIDENFNLYVAKNTSTEINNNGDTSVTNTLEEVKIPYKNLISPYTLSFNFFISLQQISQNAEYVSAVADLITKNNYIELTIFDSTQVNTVETIYTYTQNKKLTNGKGNVDSGDADEKTEIIKTVTTTSNLTATVTKAKVWAIEHEAEYSNETSPIEYPLGNDGQTVTSDDEVEPEENTGEWKTNQKKVVIQTIEKNEWKSGVSTTNINPDLFFGLWKNKIGKYKEGEPYDPNGIVVEYSSPQDSSYKESPLKNIFSSEEILCQLLEKSEDSQYQSQVMRYLLNLYRTGEKLELDLSIFDTFEWHEINDILLGNTVEENIWYALREAGYNEYQAAGALGNIFAESSFDPGAIEKENGVGFGLCQWSYDRREQLESYALSKGVPASDVATQLEFLISELTPGGVGAAARYTDYQWISYNGYSADTWENATSPEEAALAFCWSFERPADPDEQKRTDKAREYYETFKGLELGGSYSKNTSNSGIIIGTFTSGLNGRTFTVFRQNAIKTDRVWSDRCNRASQISVCSGYYNGNPTDLITKVSASAPSDSTLYMQCNLGSTSDQKSITNSTYPTDKIKSQIMNRGQVILYLKGSYVKGTGISKYGRKWASSMHWVAILGYRKVNDQEEIFVSDSGHGNTGWQPIDEFDGMAYNVVLVNQY